MPDAVKRSPRLPGEGLDRFIATFAPRLAARRIKARAQAESVNAGRREMMAWREIWRDRRRERSGSRSLSSSSYRGAEKTRIRQHWLPGSGSADEDLLGELPDLRDRSRDLNRNDGYAAGITSTMTTNTIGAGIKPQSRLDWEELGISEDAGDALRKQAEAVWHRWAPSASANDDSDVYELQELISRSIDENGDCFVLPLMIPSEEEPDRPYSLALEVIEADRCVTPSGEQLADKKPVRSGVHINERGKAQGYWFRQTHPGDTERAPAVSGRTGYTYLPKLGERGRPNVIHLFHKLRIGGHRGPPLFSAALPLFKDLGDMIEAEVVAKRIEACFALFFKTADPYAGARGHSDDTDADSKRVETLEPGLVEYLKEGEEPFFVNPQRPGTNFEAFVVRILKWIAGSIGMPFEVIAKEFAGMNYSNARTALLEARRVWRNRQDWFSRKLLQPVWRMLLEEAWLRGELTMPRFYQRTFSYTRARWIAPGWGWVDPTKEVDSSRRAVEGTLSTLTEELASRGLDLEETIETRARERKLMEKHDVPELISSGSKPGEGQGPGWEPAGNRNDDKEEK